MNSVDTFRQAIARAGLTPPETILADGKLHRFSSNGDRDDDAGWYVLFDDGLPAGAFGCWRSGLNETWRGRSNHQLTDVERAEYQRRIKAVRQQREAEEQRRHTEAAARARTLWDLATPASAEHPYLENKQVQPHGLRVDRENRLIIPVKIDNILVSLQFIDGDGKKTFLPGGAIKGGSFTIGDLCDARIILVGEGFSTMATVHAATRFPVVVAFHAGNLKPVAELLRRLYPTARIVVCGDNDIRRDGTPNTGLEAATAAANVIGGVLAMPALDGQKCDFNDLAQAKGLHAVRGAIEKILKEKAQPKAANDQANAQGDHQEPEQDRQQNLTRETDPFRIEHGRIVRVKQTQHGPVAEPLCNFTAKVTEEIELDDGAETTRAFIIEGTLDAGATLPTVCVPVSKFSSMNWVTESWGLRAIVRAGTTSRDYLREAIQRLSPSANQRHVFTHTGWRDIGGQHVYLTSGGAIGFGNAVGYEVNLGQDLSRYCLPVVAEDTKEAMQASLRLLKVAPLSVTALLWSGIFRAPLATIHPLDLSLWIEGQTGSLKSTLCALFLSHFGDFDRTNLAQWSSTANQLERRAFLLKDAVFVIDDWAPNHLDQRELEIKAARLLRAQGNLAGRGRLRADLSERPTYHPRGLIVATGEQHPPGQSILARTLLAELNREAVDIEALTEAQRNKAVLGHAMSGYLQWLAPQMPMLPDLMKATFMGARLRASTKGEHLRVPEALAHLWLGLDTGLRYAEVIGAVSAQEAKDLANDCWAALCQVGQAQGTLVEEERPTRRFLTVLVNALTQHKARLLLKQYGGGDDANRAEIIGWEDEDFLYLLPEAAFRSVVTYCRESSAPFAMSLERLRRDFQKEGVSECEEGRYTTKIRVGDQTKRVLKLHRGVVEQLIDQQLPKPAVPIVPTYDR